MVEQLVVCGIARWIRTRQIGQQETTIYKNAIHFWSRKEGSRYEFIHPASCFLILNNIAEQIYLNKYSVSLNVDEDIWQLKIRSHKWYKGRFPTEPRGSLTNRSASATYAMSQTRRFIE